MKRLLAVLMTAAMLLGCLPFGVSAGDMGNDLEACETEAAAYVGASAEAAAEGTDGAAAETAAASNPFRDLAADSYYYEPVIWGYGAGIANGKTAASFGPNNTCTRGEAITFLWRFAGSPVVSADNQFTDVKSSSYCYKAVMWAVSKGITSGTTATTFSPDRTLNRGEFVTFLWRYLGKPSSGSSHFSDVKSGSYYNQAVSYCYSSGIVSGTTATTFSPGADCTRGQVMTFLYRYRKPWLDQYVSQLTSLLNENSESAATMHFALAYIDNDEIPELLFSQGPYHVCGASVYSILNGSAVKAWSSGWSFGNLHFAEKTGKVYTEDVQMGVTITDIVTISHGSAAEHELTYNSGYMTGGVPDYSYDGADISAGTYQAYHSQYVDSYTWTSFCGLDRTDGLALTAGNIQTMKQNYTSALMH